MVVQNTMLHASILLFIVYSLYEVFALSTFNTLTAMCNTDNTHWVGPNHHVYLLVYTVTDTHFAAWYATLAHITCDSYGIRVYVA